jgi:hypothetical protein
MGSAFKKAKLMAIKEKIKVQFKKLLEKTEARRKK